MEPRILGLRELDGLSEKGDPEDLPELRADAQVVVETCGCPFR